MACFVQIFTYTTVYSKIKDKKNKKIKTFPYLPTHKLKNKSVTGLFFSRPYGGFLNHHISKKIIHLMKM